ARTHLVGRRKRGQTRVGTRGPNRISSRAQQGEPCELRPFCDHHGVAASAFLPPGAVTRIVIDSVVSPSFGGASYGTIGQYETLSGRAFGELDPSDRRNRIITDLQLAPRNSSAKVEYTA